jgi:acetylornithine/succinyldiaminopimelate/putrescine aminotransferase
LTGFYRTGSLFAFSKYSFVPDIVLLGKALGNGFPVSAVVMRKDIEVKKEMLPKSTFADNPLAAAVVNAVLKQYKKAGWSKKTNLIAILIQEQLEPLKKYGVVLRGAGACWILDLPAEHDYSGLTEYFVKKRLGVNQVKNYLRLLPPLIVKRQTLKKACFSLVKGLKETLINY